MGAGLAKQAADRWPELPFLLANHIRTQGITLGLVTVPQEYMGNFKCDFVFCLPTKYHFQDEADLNLINQQVKILAYCCTKLNIRDILVPMLGTGLGRLDVDTVVPILEAHLDDRFTLVEQF